MSSYIYTILLAARSGYFTCASIHAIKDGRAAWVIGFFVFLALTGAIELYWRRPGKATRQQEDV